MTAKIHTSNAYTVYNNTIIGKNSLAVTVGMFLKQTTFYCDKAAAGDTIMGVSASAKTFASDNQTVAKDSALYLPTDIVANVSTQEQTFEVPVWGDILTFSAALVTSNVINMKVNGVSLTQITFSTDDNTTLGLIGAQLVTDFPTLFQWYVAATATHTVKMITLVPPSQIVFSNIAVTAGASQATCAATNFAITNADEGKYYDIATWNQNVDYTTASTTTGQLRLVHMLSGILGEFAVVNN